MAHVLKLLQVCVLMCALIAHATDMDIEHDETVQRQALSIALTDMTVGNAPMCLGTVESCPFKFKSMPIAKTHGNEKNSEGFWGKVMQCPSSHGAAEPCAKLSSLKSETKKQFSSKDSARSGIQAMVNLQRAGTYSDDSMNPKRYNCNCQSYLQVESGGVPFIASKVVLEIPGKRICKGSPWWKGKNNRRRRITQKWREQPMLKTPFLRIVIQYTLDGETWKEYPDSFFYRSGSPYTMQLKNPFKAKAVRTVLVCSDSAQSNSFPQKFDQWGYAYTREDLAQCKPTESDDCSCLRVGTDSQGIGAECSDNFRTVKMSIESDATFFNWDDEIKTEVKKAIRLSPDTQALQESSSLPEEQSARTIDAGFAALRLASEQVGHTSLGEAPTPSVAGYLIKLRDTQSMCPKEALICPGETKKMGTHEFRPGLDCEAINSNEAISKRFHQWRTPGTGRFIQEPNENEASISLNVTADDKEEVWEVWDTYASKRNRVVRGFYVEKRMICAESAGVPVVCCVNKFIRSIKTKESELTQSQNNTMAAILRNF